MTNIVNEGTPSQTKPEESATPKSPILENVVAWWVGLSAPEQNQLRSFAKDFHSPMLDIDDLFEMIESVPKRGDEIIED